MLLCEFNLCIGWDLGWGGFGKLESKVINWVEEYQITRR